MDLVLLYRERVLTYMQVGASCRAAYEHAALDTVALGHSQRLILSINVTPSRALDRLIKKAVEGWFPGEIGSMQWVVNDQHDGPLVRIPRPSCMERNLPKNRRPTEDEFNKAWEKCASGES